MEGGFNMARTYVLWLIWQNEKTRQRYHIGNLEHHDGEYIFYYEKSEKRRTLFEAMDAGYKPHLSFRDIESTYTSDVLMGPFARRLPDKRRPDYLVILRGLGLTPDCTEMDLLRATGGKLATDSYEFVAPIYVHGDHYDFDFYVAGWRYHDGEKALANLTPNMKVSFLMEPTNIEDPEAVIVLSDELGHKLGYIPSFYSGFMCGVIQRGENYQAKIESIYPFAEPQQKVKISVEGKLQDIRSMLLDQFPPLKYLQHY
jgi:hypothetical protein